MRILYRYRDTEKVFDHALDEVVIGRPRGGVHVDIDLTPDLRVSRPHAKISFESGHYWIEDLGSTNGTTLDGQSITAVGKIRVEPGQIIGISDTTLTIEVPDNTDPDETVLLRSSEDAEAEIIAVIDAAASAFDTENPPDPTRAQQMALLYELPLRFAKEVQMDTLLQTIVEQLVSIIPAANRGALLVREGGSGSLLLRAHVPAGEPSVSMTLARRAMAERQALIWTTGIVPSRSQMINRIQAGMYAPLIWLDEVVGVVCVDNSDAGTQFTNDDLRLMVAVAHYAAMALKQHRLDSELRENSLLLGRLLANFSPKIRDRLLSRARHGRLRLGGERSDVVVLESDIRGFTALSAGMDEDEVVDLLNEYFSALVDAIFLHDGTIDKFVGDAILAVFGSPEPDARRYENAIHAALAMQKAAAEVTRSRRSRDLVGCDFGIGIHCGTVLHGFIGSTERMELTIIGEAVNWTSRFCAGAAAGEILISPALHQHIWQLIETEPVVVEAKHEGDLRAYRVKGLRGR